MPSILDCRTASSMCLELSISNLIVADGVPFGGPIFTAKGTSLKKPFEIRRENSEFVQASLQYRAAARKVVGTFHVPSDRAWRQSGVWLLPFRRRLGVGHKCSMQCEQCAPTSTQITNTSSHCIVPAPRSVTRIGSLSRVEYLFLKRIT